MKNYEQLPLQTRNSLLATAISLALIGGANAQSAQEDRSIEEVLVTATKRVTSVAQTPLAISAFDQETLDKQHVVNVLDLQRSVPSLHIAQNGSQNTPLIFIRGVGSTDQSENGDPAVAFHIDGIYSARSQGATAMMYDVASVEVLRGPQGTLFGRNSTGGVINIQTAKPEQNFDANFEYLVGNNNRIASKGMINLPVTSTWALRFAGAVDQADGIVNQLPGSATGPKYGSTDLTSYRISSLWTPIENINWLVSLEEFNDQGTGQLPTATGDEDRAAFVQTPGINNFKITSWRTRLDYNFAEDLTLSYLGGKTDSSRISVWDRSLRDGFYDFGGCVDCDHESTQHELQIKNDDGATFKWMLGAFFFEENNAVIFDQLRPNAALGGHRWATFRQPDRGLESNSYFGQATYEFTDTLRFTVGARHTSDERWDIGGRNISCPATVTSYTLANVALARGIAANQGEALAGQCWATNYNDTEKEWTKDTGMLRLEWDLLDDTMLFASYATGFKSGTLTDGAGYTGTESNPDGTIRAADLAAIKLINKDETNQTQAYVNPEENVNIEFGVKTTHLDERLQVFGNIFYTTYEDLQVTSNVLLPNGTDRLRKTNAGEASIKGLEVEFKWLVGEHGRLDGAVSLLDAVYDEFYTTDTLFSGTPDKGSSFGNPIVKDSLLDFSGNRMVQAPERTLSLTYEHEIPLAQNGALVPRLGMHYSSDIWFDPANRGNLPANYLRANPATKDLDRQDAYTTWDISLTYKPQTGNWLAEAYVKNLTDEAVKNDQGRWTFNGDPAPAPNWMWAPSRTYGLRIKYQFE